MRQKLLVDIELDVQELSYLVDSLSKEPTPALYELLKRNILQMQGRLDRLLQELDSAQQTLELPPAPVVAIEKEEEEGKVAVVEKKVEFCSFIPIQEEQASSVLGECIQSATDLRRSISLNDSFRFALELFEGNSEQMNCVLEQISAMSSFNAAVAFLSSKLRIDEENEAMVDFLELIKKHFKQST